MDPAFRELKEGNPAPAHNGQSLLTGGCFPNGKRVVVWMRSTTWGKSSQRLAGRAGSGRFGGRLHAFGVGRNSDFLERGRKSGTSKCPLQHNNQHRPTLRNPACHPSRGFGWFKTSMKKIPKFKIPKVKPKSLYAQRRGFTGKPVTCEI